MADQNNNERSQSDQLGAPNLFVTPSPDLRLQPPPNTHHDDGGAGSGGGSSTGEHRPRGRPPGSRNKPKTPAMVMHESPRALHSHMLEVSAGADVVASLVNFTRSRGRGINILSGNGMVLDVTLRQPGSPAGSVVTVHGQFQILSISGSVLPHPIHPGADGLSVYLSRGHGQVVGGIVVGPLRAWGPVFLMAASFSNTKIERLPLVSEDQQQQPPQSTSQFPGVTAVVNMTEGGGGGGGGGGGSAPLFGSRIIQFSSSSSSSAAVPDGNLFGWGANNTTGRS